MESNEGALDLWKAAEFLRARCAEDLGELSLSAGRSGRFRMGGCRWSIMHHIIADSDGEVSSRVLISQETVALRTSDSEAEPSKCIAPICAAMDARGYSGAFENHQCPLTDCPEEWERTTELLKGRWDRVLPTRRELETEFRRYASTSLAVAFGLAASNTLDTMITIQEVVARSHCVEVEQLRANKQHPTLLFPRQLAMYLGIELAMKNAIEIAEYFGSATQADVVQARKKIKALIGLDPSFARKVKGMARQVEKSLPTE